ncbi:MAG: peptidylprolyl isomerase [Chitinophagaceae bacterium]|nr:peptidylprolyl isomerase [Chitinophagaceae bacterium]
MKKEFLLAMGLLAAGTLQYSYGQTKKVVGDRIIAKVGDRIILQSDIANAKADIQRNGGELPANPDCLLMEGELIKKALVLQAEKDSLKVEDADIEAQIDSRIRYFMQNYGGREALEEIAGRTIYQMKEDFRKPIREQELANKMRAKILEAVRITPNEVKDYFNSIPKDSLPFYEAELEIGQIVIFPKANRDVESYTAKRLNDIRKQIESGQRRFDQMAKAYSEDPGSKETGGQYNLNRADKFWDPVFLSTAFKLKEGQISNVVKSKFGMHIIQCVSRNGDDAVVRHILLIPPVTEDELSAAKARLDSARAKLIAGTIKWNEAVSSYSDDEDKFSGGWVLGPDQSSMVTYDQVDKSLIPVLKSLKPGQYSQPEVFTTEQGKQGVRFVYLRTRTDPHREDLTLDYNKIAARALEEKKQNILSDWFAQRLGSYYLFVDPNYSYCDALKPWLEASAKRNAK